MIELCRLRRSEGYGACLRSPSSGGGAAGPNRAPPKRGRVGEVEQRNERAVPPAAKRGIWRLVRRRGGVPVSTGTRRQE